MLHIKTLLLGAAAAIVVSLLAIALQPASPTFAADLYPYGQCTYYAKLARPDVGNHWGNARYWADLANWYGELFAMVSPPNADYLNRGIKYAQKAQELDARGKEGYLAEARLHQVATARGSKQASQEMPQPLLKIIRHRPNDTQLHYQLAVALFDAGDKNLSRVYAARAIELNGLAPTPERRLDDAQREQARRIADTASGRQPLP